MKSISLLKRNSLRQQFYGMQVRNFGIRTVPVNIVSRSEQETFDRKYIDYNKLKFPEINPIDLRANQNGKEVKLANYRYPCQTSSRKGIVQFVHGYGEYCARYAHFGKLFAEAGYDFVGIDMKGYGHSEGIRGIIDSETSISEEHFKHIDMVDAKFGGQDVPKYIVGFSLGGLLTIKLSLERPNYYKAMGLMAPYLRLYNEADVDRVRPFVKILDKIIPYYRITPFPDKELPPRHIAPWITDPLNQVTQKVPIRIIAVTDKMRKDLTDEKMSKISVPFIMVIGSNDKVVNNEGAYNLYERACAKDKEIVVFEDQVHMILHDAEYLPAITENVVNWFEKFK